MPQCPICGKESEESKIEINNKQVINPCSLCKSYIICLCKPVSPNAKDSARKWAAEVISKHHVSYIKETVKEFLDYSYKEGGEAQPEVKLSQPAPAPDYSHSFFEGTFSVAPKKVSLKYTKTIESFLKISFIAEIIIGIIIGVAIDSDIGWLFGAIIGVFAGFLSYAMGMLIIEISKNIATGAEANLRIEDLLKVKDEKGKTDK